jgi:hypothetical protein
MGVQSSGSGIGNHRARVARADLRAGRFKGPTRKGRFSRRAADGFQAIYFFSLSSVPTTLYLFMS